MKIFMRVVWEDYFVEATPAEVDVLNRLLSRARYITEQRDDCATLTVNPDRKLTVALRILADDAVVTLDNPATQE